MARRRGFPLWLEWSGLPRALNEKIRIGAWSVLKKIIELDCERNLHPDAIEISVTDLAERVGLSPAVCRRILTGLRRQRALLVFLPESDEEAGLFQIRVPLKTPTPINDIARLHPELHLLKPGTDDRYAREAEVDPEDPTIRAVIDLYFEHVGLRMNSFILDELIFIAQRFGRREIERTLRQAGRLESPSLAWVARELRRRHGKKDKAPRKKTRR